MTTIESRAAEGQRIQREAKEYVLHSWSVQGQVNPIPVAGAEGRYFWDYDGKRYLDFASQLVNVSIGHQHPKLVAAIKEQADKLCTIGPPMATRAALDARAPARGGDARATSRCRSSRTAAPRRTRTRSSSPAGTPAGSKIIARYRSYHGATGGAITLTGDPRRWAAEPGLPGVVRMFDPYTYRCPAGHPDPCPVCTRRPAPRGDPPVRGPADRRRSDPRDRHGHERASSSRRTATSSRSARSATATGSC